MKVSVPFPLLNTFNSNAVVPLQFHTGVHGYQIWYTICPGIKNACTVNASRLPAFELLYMLSTANIVINFKLCDILPGLFYSSVTSLVSPVISSAENMLLKLLILSFLRNSSSFFCFCSAFFSSSISCCMG